MQATLTRRKPKRDESELVTHVPLGPLPVNATVHDRGVLECEIDHANAELDEILAARLASL